MLVALLRSHSTLVAFSSNYEIRHGDKGIFSFTQEDVGGDLHGLDNVNVN